MISEVKRGRGNRREERRDKKARSLGRERVFPLSSSVSLVLAVLLSLAPTSREPGTGYCTQVITQPFKSTNKIGTHYKPPVMIIAFCSYSQCPQHIDRRWTFLDLPRQTAAVALHLSWILQRQHHPMFLYCRLPLRRYWLLECNGRNSIKENVESENYYYSTFQWWHISIVFKPDLKFSSIW